MTAKKTKSRMPSVAMCGHDGCDTSCRVRYVGPVSHLRDHHALHAARGVGHVWTAAIVTGLAIVLTGAVAYTAVQARDQDTAAPKRALSADTRALMERLDKLEREIQDMSDRCTQALPSDNASADTSTVTEDQPAPAANH